MGDSSCQHISARISLQSVKEAFQFSCQGGNQENNHLQKSTAHLSASKGSKQNAKGSGGLNTASVIPLTRVTAVIWLEIASKRQSHLQMYQLLGRLRSVADFRQPIYCTALTHDGLGHQSCSGPSVFSIILVENVIWSQLCFSQSIFYAAV